MAPQKDLVYLTSSRQSGHTAAECTEPRSAEGVECRKCNQSESLFVLSSCVLILTACSGPLF